MDQDHDPRLWEILKSLFDTEEGGQGHQYRCDDHIDDAGDLLGALLSHLPLQGS